MIFDTAHLSSRLQVETFSLSSLFSSKGIGLESEAVRCSGCDATIER